MKSLLEVRGLTMELPTPTGWVRPVNEVSLRIAVGESLGLVGESGSGKTMLSLALMGLLPPGARVRGEASLTGPAPTKKLMALSEREWRDVRGANCSPPSLNFPAPELPFSLAFFSCIWPFNFQLSTVNFFSPALESLHRNIPWQSCVVLLRRQCYATLWWRILRWQRQLPFPRLRLSRSPKWAR